MAHRPRISEALEDGRLRHESRGNLAHFASLDEPRVAAVPTWRDVHRCRIPWRLSGKPLRRPAHQSAVGRHYGGPLSGDHEMGQRRSKIVAGRLLSHRSARRLSGHFFPTASLHLSGATTAGAPLAALSLSPCLRSGGTSSPRYRFARNSSTVLTGAAARSRSVAPKRSP
jgi:hypothetical protein